MDWKKEKNIQYKWLVPQLEEHNMEQKQAQREHEVDLSHPTLLDDHQSPMPG